MTESEETLSLKMNIYGILHGHFIFLLNKVYRFSVYFGDSDGKESAYNAGDPGSFHGSGRSLGEGNGYQLQYSCLENFMERSLEGYSLWRCIESDTTERLIFFTFHFVSYMEGLVLLPNIWSNKVVMSKRRKNIGKWRKKCLKEII